MLARRTQVLSVQSAATGKRCLTNIVDSEKGLCRFRRSNENLNVEQTDIQP
jgi:hypothetical protein